MDDIVSYLLGKQAGGGGGEVPTPKSYSEFQNMAMTLKNNFRDYCESLNLPAASSEAITLYTPDAKNTEYIIRYRESGYGIVWIPKLIIKIANTTQFYFRNWLGYAFNENVDVGDDVYGAFTRKGDDPQISIGSLIDNVDSSGQTIYTSSNNYATLEECLQALQSPSTTYSTPSVSSNYGYVQTGDYPFIYTNAKMVVNQSGSYPYTYTAISGGKRISSNETIEVIS